MLGNALMSTGDRTGAARAFRRELRTNPNDFEANLYLALLLQDENRLDEAMDYLRRAEQLRPRHPEVLYGLGNLHLALDDLAAAEETLRRLTEAVPEYEGGHLLLATVYDRQNKRDQGDRERAIVEDLRAKRRTQERPPPGDDAPGAPKHRLRTPKTHETPDEPAAPGPCVGAEWPVDARASPNTTPPSS
jgi:tetratricopeptide (TPR) repeat protein